ncbi:MAG TPA: hypothetical protein VKA21_13390 [Candidatus Binatia bacterium]|nr:hypothetical protein [Candidatus Binatia bacterium]
MLTVHAQRPYSPLGLATRPGREPTLSPSPHEAGRAPWRIAALALASVVGAVSVAEAAKWRHCPEQLGYHHSRLGAVSSTFIHPSRILGIYLTDHEVSESGGGFSTDADGNEVHVTYVSLFGKPIALPAITATAISPATLFFQFPDAAKMLGRTLAGPIALTVTTGGRTTANILPRHLLGLPPATDVGALMTGSGAEGALATMDTRGSIWIPVEFSFFGTMQKPMMTCPGTFTPLTAFAVGVTVRATPSFVSGTAPSYPPLRSLRQVDLFLGDFFVNGTSYYGMPVGTLPVFRISRGWGMKLCGANDAVDLVLRAPGWSRWAKPWSAFRAWMPDSRPLEIDLSHMTVDTGNLTTRGLDAFGEECVLE